MRASKKWGKNRSTLYKEIGCGDGPKSRRKANYRNLFERVWWSKERERPGDPATAKERFQEAWDGENYNKKPKDEQENVMKAIPWLRMKCMPGTEGNWQLQAAF
jgi:hypothetical protein